jgi:preprotein translocase subunit SecE
VTKGNEANNEKLDKQQKAEQSSSNFNPVAFLQESKEELNKVVWPDRQRLIGESAAVVLIVALSAASISLFDQLFSWLAKLIFT